MVARINTPSSINRALNYNEQKVQNGHAKLLVAEGFLKDADELNFYEKLNRFKQLISLNDRAKTNSLHISLNFDVSDKLDTEKLVELASTYMTAIGLACQPYLVYEHYDAGHPHIHIVTTTIRSDGSRIDTYNIGRNKSEPARKKIEQDYGLKKANERKLITEVNSASAQKVWYGKSKTKRAIQNVLQKVVNEYKYTSLPELNAVLKLYNVMADPGSKNSRVFQHHGLVYRVLDEQGNKVGVPIKASAIYNKPTLTCLEEKFSLNEALKNPLKGRIKTAIDLAFLKYPGQPLQHLLKVLDKEEINTMIRRNSDGIIYGLTYVDHRTKCVFNGSDLGKQYSAKGILERCSVSQLEAVEERQFISQSRPEKASEQHQTELSKQGQSKEGTSFLQTIMQAELEVNYVPYQLVNKGRKRKKKHVSKRL